MIVGMEHVAVEVPDLGRVRQFYENVLGLKAVMERDLPPGGRVRRLVFLEGPGFKLEFLDVPGTAVPQSFHLCFDVSSVARAVETLKTNGLEQASPVQEFGARPDGAKQYRTVFTGPVGERLEFMGPE